jgi:hypothetical protein
MRPAREIAHTSGGGLCYAESDQQVLVNPDGPEAADAIEALVEALRFYANPEIYKPHPHGPGFDRRDVSYTARALLAKLEAGDSAP